VATEASKEKNNHYESQTEIYLRATGSLRRKEPEHHGNRPLCDVHCERDCRNLAVHRPIVAAFSRQPGPAGALRAHGVATRYAGGSTDEILKNAGLHVGNM
jgi:hypothetical protein